MTSEPRRPNRLTIARRPGLEDLEGRSLLSAFGGAHPVPFVDLSATNTPRANAFFDASGAAGGPRLGPGFNDTANLANLSNPSPGAGLISPNTAMTARSDDPSDAGRWLSTSSTDTPAVSYSSVRSTDNENGSPENSNSSATSTTDSSSSTTSQIVSAPMTEAYAPVGIVVSPTGQAMVLFVPVASPALSVPHDGYGYGAGYDDGSSGGFHDSWMRSDADASQQQQPPSQWPQGSSSDDSGGAGSSWSDTGHSSDSSTPPPPIPILQPPPMGQSSSSASTPSTSQSSPIMLNALSASAVSPSYDRGFPSDSFTAMMGHDPFGGEHLATPLLLTNPSPNSAGPGSNPGQPSSGPSTAATSLAVPKDDAQVGVAPGLPATGPSADETAHATASAPGTVLVQGVGNGLLVTMAADRQQALKVGSSSSEVRRVASLGDPAGTPEGTVATVATDGSTTVISEPEAEVLEATVGDLDGFTISQAGLISTFSPFETGSLERAVDHLLDRLQLDGSLKVLTDGTSLVPEVVAAAVVISVAETVRRRLKGPGQWNDEGADPSTSGDDDVAYPGLPGRWALEDR